MVALQHSLTDTLKHEMQRLLYSTPITADRSPGDTAVTLLKYAELCGSISSSRAEEIRSFVEGLPDNWATVERNRKVYAQQISQIFLNEIQPVIERHYANILLKLQVINDSSELIVSECLELRNKLGAISPAHSTTDTEFLEILAALDPRELEKLADESLGLRLSRLGSAIQLLKREVADHRVNLVRIDSTLNLMGKIMYELDWSYGLVPPK